MSDTDTGNSGKTENPVEDFQQWASVMTRMQAMLAEHMSEMAKDKASDVDITKMYNMFGMDAWQKMMSGWKADLPSMPDTDAADPGDIFTQGLKMWGNTAAKMMAQTVESAQEMAQIITNPTESPRKDRRFADAQWQENPLFATIYQSYLAMSDKMLESVQDMDGLDAKQRKQMRMLTSGIVDAMSPSNFAMTNPEVIQRTIETKGENLLKGLGHMLNDLRKGQLTHTDPDAFELGRNIAVTPGKVVHETPMYQLIQYMPVTKKVMKTPLIIFPPWINRFYILDLNEKKSFVKWAVEQGIPVFMVSWKSADASMKDVIWDDYVGAQIDAIDTVRDALGVDSVNVIGYCVAGTTLAATLALLAARDEADKVNSATFFTAQVDFERAGDLKMFIDDAYFKLIEQVSQQGYLDGRYMAATFNMLRGRDLIWNYVVNNYLKGEDYPQFDLLHWNGDTTNLPSKWHRAYLEDLYRDNKLVVPGAMTVDGTPIDLRKIETPSFIQAGREDHIAPAESVWKMTQHLSGPYEYLLAGSGHIAGVVNHPDQNKYQYWTNTDEAASLDEFIAGAKETAGSWWPYWAEWLKNQSGTMVQVKGGYNPGKGKLKAIEDAPGSYVKAR